MTEDARPAVVAFDGSPEARAAVSAAATLFPARRLLIVSVWEPGLALAVEPAYDLTGTGPTPPSAEEIAAVDHAQHDHATRAADDGARLARELGATADPLPVADEADVAETVAAIAERNDAAVIVTGSRGLGRVRSRLLGSTSRDVLRHSGRPVLVVKSPE
jgi:nucleotide-binding universal stress UspA family protein